MIRPWKLSVLVGVLLGLVAVPTRGQDQPSEEPICEQNAERECPVVGEPVDLRTGNVWFDHTDTVIPGVGPALVFTRSYNSRDAVDGKSGTFGPGWLDTFSQRIHLTNQAKVILLRVGQASPMYFEDINSDLTYKATVPITEKSWIVKQPSGEYVRHFVDGSRDTFSAAGLWVRSTDPKNNATTLDRDASGRLSSVQNAGGRTLTFGYAGASVQPETLSGPMGLIATYEYHTSTAALKPLKKVTYGDGSGYEYAYQNGKILTVKDLSGRTLETHEYVGGKGTTSEIANGVEKLTFVYEPGRTTVTDALGAVTVYEFQEIWSKQQITKITRSSEVERFTYTTEGRALTATAAAGGITRYAYYPSGRLQSVTNPMNETTTYGYDAQGRMNAIYFPNGAVRTMTYVAAGVETITDTLSATETAVTRYVYTQRGQVEKVTDPRGKDTSFTYYPSGDLETVTDPRGKVTRFEYDPMGRRTKVIDPLSHVTETGYDARGRVTEVRYAVDTSSFSKVSFTYDLGGRLATETDALGKTTTNVYDEYGRLKATRDPLDGVTVFGYDAMSNLTSITDARGRTTSYDYDRQGRVTKSVYPNGAAESRTRDASGRLWKKKDRNGTVTTLSYDALGRVAMKSFSDGTSAVSYDYDAMGRLQEAANGADTLTLTYDLAGRLLSEKSARNKSTITYTYDASGNRLSVKLAGAPSMTYTYNNASQLKTIARGGAEPEFVFGYDDASRPESLTFPNGTTTTYELDEANQLLRIASVRQGATISDTQYTYDAAGNRLTKTIPSLAESYNYDSLHRLVAVRRAALNQHSLYSYDPVGNWTSSQGSGVLRYVHNDLNQLVLGEAGGVMRVSGTLSEPSTVTVAGQVARILAGGAFEASIAATSGSNTFAVRAQDASGNARTDNFQLAAGSGTTTYTYDSNGNLGQKVEGIDTWLYSWNAENRLVRVQKNGTEIARFSYDPFGRRIEAKTGSVSTAYVYDGHHILRSSTGSVVRTYVHGPSIDQVLAHQEGSASTYYHADGLGSVVKLTNDADDVVLTRQYDAWGNLEVGSATGGFAFTGREWDPEIGLYYYRARYYDPKAGRFISEDPVGFSAGPNVYAYVRGNPIKHVDPFGMWEQEVKYEHPNSPHYYDPKNRPAHVVVHTDYNRTFEQCFDACRADSNNFALDLIDDVVGVLSLTHGDKATSKTGKVCAKISAGLLGWGIGTKAGCAAMCQVNQDFPGRPGSEVWSPPVTF